MTDRRSTQKHKLFSEDQIISILKDHEADARVADLARHYGVPEKTIYRWRAKFGGMEVSDARKLKALEGENRKLKRLVADQALDIVMLKEINSKKW